MASIKIVQNDTKPYLEFEITQDGVPVDLTGSTVKFYMKNTDTGSVKINGSACTITDVQKENAGMYGCPATRTRWAIMSARSRSLFQTAKFRPATSRSPS